MMMMMKKSTVVSAGASCITKVFIMLAILAFTRNCRRNIIIIHFNDYHATTTTTERSSKSSVNLVLGCDNRQLLLQDTQHSITFVVPPAFNPRWDLIRFSDDPKVCELGIYVLFSDGHLVKRKDDGSWDPLLHLTKNQSDSGYLCSFSDGYLASEEKWWWVMGFSDAPCQESQLETGYQSMFFFLMGST